MDQRGNLLTWDRAKDSLVLSIGGLMVILGLQGVAQLSRHGEMLAEIRAQLAVLGERQTNLMDTVNELKGRVRELEVRANKTPQVKAGG